MSDDLTRAQDELDKQLVWGETRETRILKHIMRLVQGKSTKGVRTPVVNGRPPWVPDDGEEVFDRLSRRRGIGVDGQWVWSQPYN